MNLFVIFLTGLTTGGLSCLAVQGGLLASIISNQKKQEQENTPEGVSLSSQDWKPVGLFLLAKLISHILLGFFLGLMGSYITLSLEVKLLFQSLTALFMFASAMNLLNVHPVFRYLSFQPPAWIRKMLKQKTHSETLFAPFVLGLMTIFIPCGVTQAMEVLAINSGNPFAGALIMGTFVLGTFPIFSLVGMATAKLSDAWHHHFTKTAATLLIIMALYSFNGVLIVMNSPITFQSIVKPITFFFSDERFKTDTTSSAVKVQDGVQKVTIFIMNQGYSPKIFQVKKGVPVELTLKSNNTYSCALAFVFKEFGIRTMLESTDQQTFSFTPTKTGKFPFTCSMGMYSGVMEVL